MIECPSCWSKFSGASCRCGYTPPRTTLVAERAPEDHSILTEEARIWLRFHAGIPQDMAGAGRRAALQNYRKRLSSMPRVADREPRAWASAIISRIAHGEVLPALVERMAKEALGMEVEQ